MGLCSIDKGRGCPIDWRLAPGRIPNLSMRIRLISDDQFLHNLCREVLLGFRGRDWDFTMVASGDDHALAADLLIWDLSPNRQPPEKLDSGPQLKNIFL